MATLNAEANASLDVDSFGLDDLPSAPYPGLRPFEPGEWSIFFGRERMTEEVIRRLVEQRLIVVHGDSGSGKSSLIAAGVLPRLAQESLRCGTHWLTCTATPGDQPLWNLAQAIAGLKGRADDALTLEVRRLFNYGRGAGKKLSEFLGLSETSQFCILLDQFEELFAQARRAGPDEARLIAEFLVGIFTERPLGICVAVTMRSEFLGSCAAFPDFAESVNSAQYLLPRMRHADLMRAIQEPATLFDGHISRELAEQLIQDAGGTQDQLPVIQHGLMMLYRESVLAQPGHAGSAWQLGVLDYKRHPGGLAGLLSLHADEVAAKAAEPGSRIVEDCLRALTDINSDGQAIRRPRTFQQLLDITGATTAALQHILDAFRAEGVSFLRPYGEASLTPETRIDISHEALIRCWKRVADGKDGWLFREFKNGLVWRSLLVQADSFERDPTNLLSPATTLEREIWLKRRTPAWCDRYGGGYDRVLKLIQASQAEVARRAEAERESLVTALKQQQELEANRTSATRWSRTAVILALLVTLACGVAGYAWAKRSMVEKQLTAERELAAALKDAGQQRRHAEQAQEALSVVKVQLQAEKETKGNAADEVAQIAVALDAIEAGSTGSVSEPLRQALSKAQSTLSKQAEQLGSAPILPPRIYLQISEAQQSAAAQKLIAVLSADPKVGTISLIPPVGLQRAQANSFRCFRTEDCADAKHLLELTNAHLISPKLTFQDFSKLYEGKKLRPRQYEVWFKPGEIQLAE